MQPSSSPNPQYDFIFNSGTSAPKQSKLPVPNLPKPILIIVGALIALVLFVIVAIILSSANSGKATGYTDLLARSTEIVRVGEIAKKDVKDLDTLALLTTTNTAVGSEQTQIATYLASTGTKVDPKQLGGYLNSATDQGLASAVQNNNLEEAYITYLKGSLTGYLDALKTTYSTAGTNGKTVLAGAITSTETLLSAPQFQP